ncbi:MAG: DUF3471 domain-containing protein [Alteromonadaceae bacterium]|nr:DUF3471 domain-containing protein [Alteromonadaceae bacterium]
MIKKEYSENFKDASVLNRLGYLILGENTNVAWAIELFKLNVQLFPDDGTLWDSLGDGYKKNGDKKLAINAYLKPNKLDPTITESIKSLAELGIKVEAKVRTEAVVDELILKRYVGKYELKPGFILSVLFENGRLIAQLAGKDSMETFAESDVKFYIETAHVYIQFNKNKADAVESLTLFDGGQQMVAHPFIKECIHL